MDDLGSVLKVVESSGTVKNSYSYDPYGLSLNKSETVANPWQYASGYYDAHTSLYEFGTRYYDPQTGRWTQKDPEPSANPYVYANNMPNMETDSNGALTATQCVVGAILAGFAAVLGAALSIGTIAVATNAAGITSTQALLDALAVFLPKFVATLTPVFGWIVLGITIIAIAAAVVTYLNDNNCIQ